MSKAGTDRFPQNGLVVGNGDVATTEVSSVPHGRDIGGLHPLLDKRPRVVTHMKPIAVQVQEIDTRRVDPQAVWKTGAKSDGRDDGARHLRDIDVRKRADGLNSAPFANFEIG